MSPLPRFAVVIPPFDFNPLYEPFDEDFLERQVDTILSEQASLEEASEELNDLDMQRSPRPNDTSNSTEESTSQGFGASRSPPPATCTPSGVWAPDYEDERIFASVSQETRADILMAISRKPFLLKCPARRSERIKFTSEVSALATDAGIDQVNADALVEYVRQIYFQQHDLTPTEANRFTFGDEINDMEEVISEPIKRKKRKRQCVAKPGRSNEASLSGLSRVDHSTTAQTEIMGQSKAATECPLDVNPGEVNEGQKYECDECRKQKDPCTHDERDQIDQIKAPRCPRPRANSSAKRAFLQEDEEPANVAQPSPAQSSTLVDLEDQKRVGQQTTQLDHDQNEKKKAKRKRKRDRRNEKKRRATMDLNESTNAANAADTANVARPAQSSVIIDLTSSPPPENSGVDDQQPEDQPIAQLGHDRNEKTKAKKKRKRDRRNGEKRRASMNPKSTNAATESAHEQISPSTPLKTFASLPKDPKEWDLDF